MYVIQCRNDIQVGRVVASSLSEGADSTPTEDGEVGVAVGQDAEESGVLTPTKPHRKTKPAVPYRKVEHMPPWRVLLHNDDFNEMNFVVDSILRLTPLSFDKAYRCMLEAHEHGLSLLLATHQERAELYRDQFQSKRLIITIEPSVS